MSASTWVQDVIVAVLVMASVLYMLGKLMPRRRAAVQSYVAHRMSGPGSSPWAQRMAERIKPTIASACGSGCTACGSCATDAPAVATVDSRYSADPVVQGPGTPRYRAIRIVEQRPSDTPR